MGDVLFVIVIYNISKEKSVAWQSVSSLLGKDAERSIYLHDNTEQNSYLAQVYNNALSYARQNGFKWIALLDSDTKITADYLEAIQQVTQKSAGDTVYCPVLSTVDGTHLSPFTAYGFKVAFNSGLLIPVKIFDTITSFNEEYPLDYLDYWFCYQLHKNGMNLETLPVTLNHSLSVMDYSQMPRWRYLSLLDAEKRFAKEIHREKYYRLLLFGRWIKWQLTGHPFAHETYEAFIKR